MVGTIAELRRRFLEDEEPLTRADENALREDPRAGVQAMLRSIENRRAKNRAEGQRLRKILSFERRLWEDGLTYVAGVDEAGMSPLAGPVVAAAVILPVETTIRNVDDSKKLDAKTRERLAAEIKSVAVAWAVGEASPEEIDEINIHHAGLLAMRRAVLGLGKTPDFVLVDGKYRPRLTMPMEALIKGDSRSLSIAAASILAKTTRDRQMIAYDAKHPGYGFAQHKGYPVRAHQEAIRALGVLPIHRRSFAAVRDALLQQSDQLNLIS